MAFEDFLLNHARVSSKPHKRVTLDDKMTFFQQLGSLSAAGVPILEAIQIGAQQSQSTRFAAVLVAGGGAAPRIPADTPVGAIVSSGAAIRRRPRATRRRRWC